MNQISCIAGTTAKYYDEKSNYKMAIVASLILEHILLSNFDFRFSKTLRLVCSEWNKDILHRWKELSIIFRVVNEQQKQEIRPYFRAQNQVIDLARFGLGFGFGRYINENNITFFVKHGFTQFYISSPVPDFLPILCSIATKLHLGCDSSWTMLTWAERQLLKSFHPCQSCFCRRTDQWKQDFTLFT